MTKKRKLLLAALAATSISCAVPAFAALDVYVDAPPPAARYEVVPAPRAGFVWQPGYWDWSHGRHAWHKGYWVKERRGYYWHPSRWEERNGRYHLVQGRWDRERYAFGDRDHDGVPNRFDRDRDNDGVPNRYDRAPDNPNRR
jgi:hypothetical protein